MADKNILLAGFGGQGVLFSGKVMAYAGLVEGKNVSWLPSYGPEMRGGTANCSVVISDEPVSSPLVLAPEILIAMNQPSFDKFINTVVPGGVVIADSTLIEPKCDRDDIKCVFVDATNYADANDFKGLANIILMGKVLKETSFAEMASVEAAIKKSVPPKKAHLVEVNMRAIAAGMDL